MSEDQQRESDWIRKNYITALELKSGHVLLLKTESERRVIDGEEESHEITRGDVLDHELSWNHPVRKVESVPKWLSTEVISDLNKGEYYGKVYVPDESVGLGELFDNHGPKELLTEEELESHIYSEEEGTGGEVTDDTDNLIGREPVVEESEVSDEVSAEDQGQSGSE